MKKTIVFALVLFSTVAFSQLQKGNILLGGSIGVTNSKSENPYSPTVINTSKSTSFDINPRIGVFLSNRSVLGLESGYNFTKSEYGYTGSPTTTDKNSNISIKPFYRFYFPIGEKIAFYLHSRAGLAFGKSNQHYSYFDPNTGVLVSTNQKSDLTSAEISIVPGVAFFITPKWSIETMISSLGYSSRKAKPKSGESTTNSSFGFQSNVFSFGMNWYFGK